MFGGEDKDLGGREERGTVKIERENMNKESRGKYGERERERFKRTGGHCVRPKDLWSFFFYHNSHALKKPGYPRQCGRPGGSLGGSTTHVPNIYYR